ncbi:MAG: large-conductance mechanosensitive channel protein MscL [Bacteroidota bacterium]|nr:large-conductance mechanosensitive channel protein MscL [Bacteroidota bacterium]
MFKEFKTFILRGNVLDLAVGIIIGAAFGRIVSSFVNDLLMPPLGLLIGNVNFTDLKIPIGGSLENPVTINYGNLMQTLVEFFFIAVAIFILIRIINALNKKDPPVVEDKSPVPNQEELLLRDIRDILKSSMK